MLMEVEILTLEIGKFLASLDDVTHLKVIKNLHLLERYGNEVGFPHSRKLLKDIYELRMAGRIAVRLLYTFHNGKAIILHGFIKKTNKTPKREIETALARLNYLHSR